MPRGRKPKTADDNVVNLEPSKVEETDLNKEQEIPAESEVISAAVERVEAVTEEAVDDVTEEAIENKTLIKTKKPKSNVGKKSAVKEETKDTAKTAVKETKDTAKTAVKETKDTAKTAVKETKGTAKTAVKETKDTAKTLGKETKDTAKTAEKETKKSAAKKAVEKITEKTGKEKNFNIVDAKVIFQGYGFELEPKVILENAKEDWLAKGHKLSQIKSIELYIKPEEWSAYYVINGVPDQNNRISLD